jgi:hypothetical protein
MEASGLRVPGPNAQLNRVTGKGSAAGQRLGLTAQTDPVAVPQAAAPPPSTTPLIPTPSTLQGGAEAGQRPGLTARTDPAEAPPPGTLPVIYMPDTENISDEEMVDRLTTPPRPIPVLETRSVHFTHTIPSHQPSSPQPGPSRITQPYHKPSNRLSMPTQVVTAARGRYRSSSRSLDRQSGSKRAATPLPQRRVVKRPEPSPEDDEEVLILGVTPDDTGFLGPILTNKPRKKRR